MARQTAKKSAKSSGWPVRALDPPRLNDAQWILSGLLGLLFLLMALLQLISFSDFRDELDTMGLPSATTWAVALILAELWAAAGFFKVRLSALFRQVSMSLAVLVSGFWFVLQMELLSTGREVSNSAFFGRFLEQTPGWWSVLEVSLVLFLVLYAAEVVKDNEVAVRSVR